MQAQRRCATRCTVRGGQGCHQSVSACVRHRRSTIAPHPSPPRLSACAPAGPLHDVVACLLATEHAALDPELVYPCVAGQLGVEAGGELASLAEHDCAERVRVCGPEGRVVGWRVRDALRGQGGENLRVCAALGGERVQGGGADEDCVERLVGARAQARDRERVLERLELACSSAVSCRSERRARRGSSSSNSPPYRLRHTRMPRIPPHALPSPGRLPPPTPSGSAIRIMPAHVPYTGRAGSATNAESAGSMPAVRAATRVIAVDSPPGSTSAKHSCGQRRSHRSGYRSTHRQLVRGAHRDRLDRVALRPQPAVSVSACACACACGRPGPAQRTG